MANPITPKRRKILARMKKGRVDARSAWVKKNPNLLREHVEIITQDTVGAVAVDSAGNFAAASSTGGTMMKLPGRIGDTPQIGSGLYADNRSGAATVTGWGETAIRLALSKAVCMMMENGATATNASELAIMAASKRLQGDMGVIAIDRGARMAAVHNTPYMPWAFWTATMRSPRAKSRGKRMFPIR
jgi:isoaspartyl peptidase/L-asparaginase-like protein (Ntn-hydrolase superfamily)